MKMLEAWFDELEQQNRRLRRLVHIGGVVIFMALFCGAVDEPEGVEFPVADVASQPNPSQPDA